jgi:uroporphyrinogen decarboxylase
MKHRERVQMALDRQAPDRCPMQISFTPEFADRLRADLQARGNLLHQGHQLHNPHGGGNTYALERALDQDLLLTSVGWANSYYQDASEYVDEWGVGWRAHPYSTPFGVGHYTEMVIHPLADDDAIDRYTPPDPHRPELYTDAARVVQEYGGEYWIVGVTVTTMFETAWALRGYEQMLIDLLVDPDLADRILEIPYRYHLAAAEKLARLGVDMIWLGDDIGTQRAMLMAPDTWRRLLKGRMANFIATLKAINPAIKVAYHSDGVITPIIPDLIEIGLDVLNPIQPACMDPAEIKRQFGDHLCFWGSIDEQHTLPFGSPQEVADEVRTRLRTLGKGGGLILGPTHHVQLDTPMENFWAMVETIKQTPYPSGKEL